MKTLTYSERLKMEKLFLAWCDKQFVDENVKIAKRPTAFLSYMLIREWLNVEKISEDLKKEIVNE